MRRENVPAGMICSFPWLRTPYMALLRYGLMFPRLERAWNRLDSAAYAEFVAKRLEATDVFHGLSGHNLKPGLLAKERGGSYVCDRGSSHIVYQDRIMREEGERMGVPVEPIDAVAIESELAEYSACDRIFVASSFARRTFIEAGIAPDKLWSLPYGTSLEHWGPIPVAADGKFRVVYAGSLSLRKGVGDLLAAFERAALPNSEVVLIGGRSAESDRLLKPYRQVPNTIITGQLPQPKMREWFARSSVFVLPSIEDGFGLVIMEAQACGLPVIATVNTGGPDVIDDGRNGFVVPIRSPDAIAEKLAFLYANPDQLRAMREESLLTAKNSRGWDAFAQGMLELYGELRNGS